MSDQNFIDVHVRKGWVFWQAFRLDDPVGEFDSPTVYRSTTKQGAIDKARHVNRSPWQKVRVPLKGPGVPPDG